MAEASPARARSVVYGSNFDRTLHGRGLSDSLARLQFFRSLAAARS